MPLRAAHHAHQASHTLPGLDAGDEQPVIAPQGDLTHQLLDSVVVDRNLAMVRVDRRRFPMIVQIVQSTTYIGLRQNVGFSQAINVGFDR